MIKKLNDLNRKELSINGIYKIINIINNKFYIGSSSSKSFLYTRLIHHLNDLRNSRHCNKYLQRAFDKYGEDSFYYEILEVCNSENCIMREQYYIDNLKPDYNLLKFAGSSFGRECTNVTRIKISNANKLKWKDPNFKKEMIIKFATRKNIKIKLNKEVKKVDIFNRSIIDLNTNIIYSNIFELSKVLRKSSRELLEILELTKFSKLINIEYVES